MLAKLILLAVLMFNGHPDFSGTWKLNNGNATLHIEHHEPDFSVETLSRGRKVLQRYTTDGRESVSTGIDGDEFHSKVTWQGDSLVFDIEEHEDGKILKSKETWSLIENGSELKRHRITAKAPNGQTWIYSR